jgi:hypothetical protein
MKSPLHKLKGLDLDRIDWGDTERIKELFKAQMYNVELLLVYVAELEAEILRLKEIKSTKGKGKPGSSPSKQARDFKSKQDYRKWKKRSKKDRVRVDEEKVVKIDPTVLPEDAEFKGYYDVVKQELVFQTCNVRYFLERYYSPSQNKTFTADLPEDTFHGEYGPRLKSFIHYLYYKGRVPEKKIQQILADAGIIISIGKISNILTLEKQEIFSKIREDILETGLNACSYVQTDDTRIKHKGVRHSIHILCNSLYSVYTILEGKDRPNIRKLLGVGETQKLDKILVSDDAKAYDGLSNVHSICWYHEIKHYLELEPILEDHRRAYELKLAQIWDYFHELQEYKYKPSGNLKKRLWDRFDEIFKGPCDYELFIKRMSLTYEKKKRLLAVLDHPELPLTNNESERGLRESVLKRVISWGTRSESGKKAWENMFTIMDTCRKLNVNFHHYLTDIFSEKNQMTPLHTLIHQKTTT